MTLKNVLKGFGVIAIIITIIPLFALDYWWIRMFDFPHIQLTFLTAAAILFYIFKFDFKSEGDYAFILVLISCFIFQFIKIYPYTSFADVELLDSNNSAKNISFLTSNVYQDNEDTKKIIEAINASDADVMVFTEANKRWQDVIANSLSKDYKYSVEYPLENTYGMLLYSKLKLISPKVEFMVDDSIPSIHTKIQLKSGEHIKLHAIHPTPPMPQHNPKSTSRDAEMMKIAKRVMDSKIPVVVLGDFNDVSWSSTNLLFKKGSMLLDPRIGRGVFSTFNAKSLIFRWPLDHIFCSKEFRYKEFKTYSSTSSDHFPVYAEFTFEPEVAYEQEQEKVDQKIMQRIENQLKQYKDD